MVMFILRVLLTIFLCSFIMPSCILLSFLLWDIYYMDKAQEMFDRLWEIKRN